jgi:quercetin dioxygenase-like cupin family protein
LSLCHLIDEALARAPRRTGAGEDEYSYVLEWRMGAQLGDDVVYAEAGDLVFKPRNKWHTFWNAGDRHRPGPSFARPG